MRAGNSAIMKRISRSKESKNRPGNGLWRLLRWPFWLTLIAFLGYQSVVFAQVVWFKWNNPTSTAFIDVERERLAQAKSSVRIRQIWVPYSAISVSVKQAVIAAGAVVTKDVPAREIHGGVPAKKIGMRGSGKEEMGEKWK